MMVYPDRPTVGELMPRRAHLPTRRNQPQEEVRGVVNVVGLVDEVLVRHGPAGGISVSLETFGQG